MAAAAVSSQFRFELADSVRQVAPAAFISSASSLAASFAACSEPGRPRWTALNIAINAARADFTPPSFRTPARSAFPRPARRTRPSRQERSKSRPHRLCQLLGLPVKLALSGPLPPSDLHRVRFEPGREGDDCHGVFQLLNFSFYHFRGVFQHALILRNWAVCVNGLFVLRRFLLSPRRFTYRNAIDLDSQRGWKLSADSPGSLLAYQGRF